MPIKNPAKQPAKTTTAASAAAKRIRATRTALSKGPAGAGKKHPAAKSAVFMDPDTYKAHIDGMMAQGLDRADAVDTLKVGIREANGFAVPKQLLAQISAAAPAA